MKTNENNTVRTKCIKVTLNRCVNYNMKEIIKIIREMQYLSSKAYNLITNYLYIWDTNSMNFKNLYEEKIVDKDLLGKSKSAWIENRMNEFMKGFLTSNVAQARRDVMNKYDKSKKDGLLIGKVTLPSYRIDGKVLIHNNSYRLSKNEGYFVKIGLFNKEKKKELNCDWIKFKLDKIDSNKKATIYKILNGDYKQGSAQLYINKKGKIEFIISYSFEIDKSIKLDKNRTLGVDVGIVNIAAMAIWDNNKQEWELTRYSHNLISGNEAIALRQKYHNLELSEKELEKKINIELHKLEEKEYRGLSTNIISGHDLIYNRMELNSKRIKLAQSCKWCGNSKVGHGRKIRCKQVDKIGNKIERFKDTFNHKYSRYIVDFAVKNNCGIIQMEDLKNFNPSEKFLKDWPYFDLQTKIEYKAKEYGIEVIRVNPQYTSKRCSRCGCIDELNRDCKKSQSKFKCVNNECNNCENADINAAKNIALPYIDKIIERCLEDNKVV